MAASYLYTSSQHSIASFYLGLQSEDYQCSTCMYHNPQLGSHCSGHIAFSFYLLWKPKSLIYVPSPLRLRTPNKVRCTAYLPVIFLVSPLYLVRLWYFAPVYVCVTHEWNLIKLTNFYLTCVVGSLHCGESKLVAGTSSEWGSIACSYMYMMLT